MLSEQWKKRILILAEKYGPNVRFYPEGTEDDVVVEKPQPPEKTPEEQKAIDDARKQEQAIEQERANAVRAKEAASRAQSDLETAQSENEGLKEKLAAAEAKAAEAGIEDVELDESQYDGTDLALVRAIKTLNKQIEVKDKRTAVLEEKVSSYETQSRKDKELKARNTAYEELLGDLDDEYGADCRNGAVERFNTLIADGKVPKGNTARATRLIEKCYKEAKAAKSKKTSENKGSSLPLDSGSGGGIAPNLSGAEIPDGLSLDEAVAHIAKAKT